MSKLKILNQEKLRDWAKEIFQKNSFNMVDVSSKKETFRRALASGKIYVGKEVFDLIKNNKMPKGDPITCLLYTSPSPRDKRQARMPSSA